jgi:hypothetical protein
VSENGCVGASGYHSPASFHKDDNRARPTIAPPRDRQGIAGRGKYPSLAGGIHSKLLNMRDFRALEGFPLPAETRYNSFPANRRQTGAEHRPGLFPPAWLFMPKRAIGSAKFRAYMLQTHSMM